MCCYTKGTSVTRSVEFEIYVKDTSAINFTDVGVGEGTLDQYLFGNHVVVTGEARAGRFRPIGTKDNEVCLFPVTASVRLCTVVASMFARSRSEQLSTHCSGLALLEIN